MSYEDRMMTTGREAPAEIPAESAKRSGHPTGALCVKCGNMMYFAETLKTSTGELKNVEYCGGGCGNIVPAVLAE